MVQGSKKLHKLDILPHPNFYFYFYFLSRNFSPFSPLDILTEILNILEKIILLRIFFHAIFFPMAMIYPSTLNNLIFFPNRLDKGIRNFIHPAHLFI